MDIYEIGLELLSKRSAIDKHRLEEVLSENTGPVPLILLDGSKVLLEKSDVELLGELARDTDPHAAWRMWRGYAKRAAAFGFSISQIEKSL